MISIPRSATPATLGYKPHPALLGPIGYADRLARAIGPNCEIVVHDLRHPEKSLVHIAGNVTGRSIGAPVTNVVLEALRAYGDDAPDLFNYRTQAPNGRVLRSSTLFIRSSGRIVGVLCINLDMTPLEDARVALDQSLNYEIADTSERFGNTVEDVLDNLFDAVLRDGGVRPSNMTPDDRLRAVAALEERGVFLIRGGVDRVARELRVSKFTVYNYLQQVRAARTLEANSANRLNDGRNARDRSGGAI